MSKILAIVKHPDPVLRLICARVTVFDQKLKDLAADMLYTIDQNEENARRIGVGLGAPQVNAPICLVVIAAPGFPELAMCNPSIERGKGSKLGNEACLSLPGQHADVARFTDIWVSYQDLNGKPCRMKARDFHARVIQHEVDHLRGIEYTDRVGKEPVLNLTTDKSTADKEGRIAGLPIPAQIIGDKPGDRWWRDEDPFPRVRNAVPA